MTSANPRLGPLLLACALANAVMFAGVPAAAGGFAGTLKQGEDLYFAGNYEEALFFLEELSRAPKVAKGTRVAALKYVAFCYFLLKAKPQAKEAWLRLLALDPAFKLDPAGDSPPEFVRYFNAIGAGAAGRASAAGDAKGGGESDEKSGDSNGKVAKAGEGDKAGAGERGCGILLCLVPFGVGQFANGNIVKGLIFAASEAAFLGFNIGLYWTRVSEFDAQGRHPDPNGGALISFVVQHVMLGLYIAATALGIVDAFVFY